MGILAGAGRGERSVRGGHDGEKGDGRVVSMSMVVSFKVLDEYVPLFFSSVIVLLLNAYSQNNMLVRGRTFFFRNRKKSFGVLLFVPIAVSSVIIVRSPCRYHRGCCISIQQSTTALLMVKQRINLRMPLLVWNVVVAMALATLVLATTRYVY